MLWMRTSPRILLDIRLKKKNYVPFVSVRFMFVTELLAILVFKEPSL